VTGDIRSERWSLPYPSVFHPPAEISSPVTATPKSPEQESPRTSSPSPGRYIVNPRTGRRTLRGASLSSRFSPPSPTGPVHIEDVDDYSPPDSPSPNNRLGLDLGSDSGWSSESSSPSSGTQTPNLSPDTEEDETVAEARRLQLQKAIENLAREHALLDTDWTPPMRDTAMIDTPSTVADELVTTPDNDSSELPSASAPGKPASDHSDEEDEPPRPRLDKGKGRAIAAQPRSRRSPSPARLSLQSEYEQDVHDTLEELVMEVSRLEAQEMDAQRGGDRAIVRREIKRVSQGLYPANDS
jgi:hypothetical protein